MDPEGLDERLRAVERTLTDDVDVSDIEDRAALESRLDDLEARLDELADRVDEADAGLQAVRGYVGDLRSVNRDVERRADAALARAETVARDQQAVDRPQSDRAGDLDRRSAPRTDRDRAAPDRQDAGHARDRDDAPRGRAGYRPGGPQGGRSDGLLARVRDWL